jgi:hypothetical protein
MTEAGISVAAIIICWLTGTVIYQDDMTLTRYGAIALLSVAAAYFAIRFIHWAWITPFLPSIPAQ